VTHCRIHAFRPSSCINWVPSLYQRECRKGLANYWGLVVSPSGQLEVRWSSSRPPIDG
jgi:hypothetical protein